MFPFKRFVQGPSLHDEQISYTEQQNPATGSLSGHEASQIYEEIINLPSSASANEVSDDPVKHTSVSKQESSDKTSKHHKQETGPVPKISQLMSFCEANNHLDLEKVLSQFGNEIDINSVDEYGWTLLMSASCAGSLHCVYLLLQHGASWELKDKKGLTASCLARKNRHDRICDLLHEWNECYIELCQRKFQSSESGDSNLNAGVYHEPGEGSSETREKYCDACKISYVSSKDDHEKSIAHLVCTAQFGEEITHYGIPESNRGFQLMVKSGWDRNRGLGPEGTGHKFPVKTVLKRNKLGLGNEKERKVARITHFAPFDPAAVERQSEPTEREETVRKREAARQKAREKRKEINFRRELSSL